MNASKTPERKILVVAVNARPITESILASGQKLSGCVDYFGDWDLISMMPGDAPLYSVIRQEKGKINKRNLTRSLSETLFLLAEEIISEIDFDYIIVGGGVHGKFLLKLSELGQLLGSSHKTIAAVRDRLRLYDFCKKTCDTIKVPHLKVIVDEKSLLREIFSEEQEKRIIKPCISDGGVNTFLLAKESHLDEKKRVMTILKPLLPCYVIEYIPGVVFSTKVLSTGNDAAVLSYNLQLNGLAISHSPEKFTYSGNVVPLITGEKTRSRMNAVKEEIEELTAGLNLSGSIGFDFVVTDSEIFLLEVNPRIQGTLDPFEIASGRNVIDAMVNAIESKELMNWSPLDFKKSAVKIVLYAPDRIVVPHLDDFPVKDIPLKGSIVDKGQPFCSLVDKRPLAHSFELLKSFYSQIEGIYSSGKREVSGVD
ncbi:MAG: ATP-grasp domain-containing protein [Candidatus Hodarchaeales archaeon]